MADDRFNDVFAFGGLSIGLSQWPGASNDLWAPLITGTQASVGRWTSTISSLNKQWLDFFQRRVAENLALVEHFMSCRTPVAVWSVYTNFLQRAAPSSSIRTPDTQKPK